MDPSNASFKTSLLEDVRLSSLRRRNKSIILIFFTLIIILALIIGTIIIFLAHKHNLDPQPQTFNPSAAIREYCTPSSHSQYSCILALYNAVRISPNMYPDQIFILSLQTSVRYLSTIISMASNDTSSKPPYGNCTSSLSHAVGQLGEVLGTMRVNPDVETQTYEQRGDMIRWIVIALEDLDACLRDLGKADQSTAMIFEMNHRLSDSETLLKYSKDFLKNCEFVNDNFRFALASEESARNQVVWDLIGSSLFGLQYLVLVLLFCLLLRNYY